MPRRVLLLLPQFTHDPASGAARSMVGTARLLAAGGATGAGMPADGERFEVRALCTTATEGGRPIHALALLNQLGLSPKVDRRGAVGKGAPVIAFADRGVETEALDVGEAGVRDWELRFGPQFNRMLARTLDTFQPDLVFTFGGTPPDQSRRELCRLAGASVVFGLRNMDYLHPLAFENVDAVLTPSVFVERTYRERLGLVSTVIPSPMEPEDVVAEKLEPRFVTFVNPTPAKGIFFVMRLFDELAQRRPDVPLRIIEGRGRAEHVAQVAQLCGFDLRFMRSLTISAALPRPRDVFAQTRVLLMPTVRDEAFGRLAAEALLNGVPALVADRGGLPEAVGEGGFVLPIPAGFTFESRKPPLLSEAQPWIDTILRLVDDGVFYEAARGRALSAAGRYAPERLGAAVRAFFASVKRAGAPPLARPGGG